MSEIADAPPSALAVVGAGTMGTGIALAFALGGCPQVRLMARHESSLEKSRQRIAQSLGLLLSEGVVTEERARIARDVIEMTTSLDRVTNGCDLAIESILENLPAKQALLPKIEARCNRPQTILATNTSSLRIDELSSALSRPTQFAGFHWLNPAELVPVVEVVPGSRTDAAAVSQLVAWATSIGKVPIQLGRDIPGFVVNRLQYALLREAFTLVENGICSYKEVDNTVRVGLGARWAAVGPFETMDLAGLDVHSEVARRLYPDLSNRADVPIDVQTLVSEGELGAKTGHGLRGDYSDELLTELILRRDRILLAIVPPKYPQTVTSR